MTLTVSEKELGTPEATWRASRRLANAPTMVWDTPGPVVVLAPHPDDEVLAVGGTMRILASSDAAGLPRSIAIVAVTDGEASHPRSTAISRESMAARRAAERAVALERLGVKATVTPLGFRDGQVAGHADLAERLASLLHGAAYCVAPWELDGHPDHDATGRAARIAAVAAGVKLVNYPVWAWHWALPDTPVFPWARVRRVALDDPTLAAKRSAIAAYRSQIAPIGPAAADRAVLPAAVVARFERPFEVVFA